MRGENNTFAPIGDAYARCFLRVVAKRDVTEGRAKGATKVSSSENAVLYSVTSICPHGYACLGLSHVQGKPGLAHVGASGSSGLDPRGWR